MSSNDPDLVQVGRGLSADVQDLGRKLTITEKSLRRQKIWTAVTLVLIGVTLVALIFTYSLYRQVKVAVADNKASQVTSCQNSNESRLAAQKLWDFVIDLSSASKADTDPEGVVYLEKVRIWVHTIYQQHDCSQLAKKYPLPEPPPIPKVNR